jgi:hypoxanthine phosphoribosyltransferase
MHPGRLIITPGKIQSRVDALGKAISKAYDGRTITLCIVLKGAFVFASDLLRNLPGDTELIFLRANSYQGQERKEVVLYNFDGNLNAKDVIVVEDIVDTGHTVHAILKHISRLHPESLRVCTLLHKPTSTKKKVKIHYVGFKIPPDFVVGYGLDYNEKYRNLRGIHKLEGQPASEGLQFPTVAIP